MIAAIPAGTRNTITIETVEGVRFHLPLAGPIRRFLAWTIDELVIIAATGIAAKLLQLLPTALSDLTLGLVVISYFVIAIGYGMLLEWLWSGQTIGKRVLHLRVMDACGRKLERSQIVIRNLLRFLDTLPFLYFIGGTVMLCNRRYARVGDIVADTVVLRSAGTGTPPLAPIAFGERYNSLFEVPHLAARLRQQTPPELAMLAYAALGRRNELDPAVRVDLFASLASRFRALVTFPPESTATLSDERYLQNAVAVVFNQKR